MEKCKIPGMYLYWIDSCAYFYVFSDVLLLIVGQKTMVYTEQELSILSKVCNDLDVYVYV